MNKSFLLKSTLLLALFGVFILSNCVTTPTAPQVTSTTTTTVNSTASNTNALYSVTMTPPQFRFNLPTNFPYSNSIRVRFYSNNNLTFVIYNTSYTSGLVNNTPTSYFTIHGDYGITNDFNSLISVSGVTNGINTYVTNSVTNIVTNGFLTGYVYKDENYQDNGNGDGTFRFKANTLYSISLDLVPLNNLFGFAVTNLWRIRVTVDGTVPVVVTRTN